MIYLHHMYICEDNPSQPPTDRGSYPYMLYFNILQNITVGTANRFAIAIENPGFSLP